MSPRAAWRLEALGFTEVHWYAGGKSDWGAAGLPLEGDFERSAHAGDVARRDVPTCQKDERIRDVRERVRASGFDTCFVVTDERVVLGRLYASELGGDGDARAGDMMREGPKTFRPDEGIAELLHYMVEHELGTAPITTNEGQLIGLALRQDVERLAAEGADARETVAKGGRS